MAFDINNNFTGNVFGRDRMGHVVPDLEFTETLRPFLEIPYPAPWLPTLRQDQAHPVLASVVLTSQSLVGLDKNGAIVPAGLFCGTQGPSKTVAITNSSVVGSLGYLSIVNSYKPGQSVTITGLTNVPGLNGTQTILAATSTQIVIVTDEANVTAAAESAAHATPTVASQYCVIKYSLPDVGFAYNAITGNTVASAGETAVLAAPSDGVAGDVVTFPDGTTYSILSGDLTAAAACNLFPQGVVRPVGLTIRQVYQYIGGVLVTGNTGGISFTLDGVLPLQYKVLNYMHEMGTAISTEMIVRVPWIGESENALQGFASNDGIVGYNQSAYGRSFAHFVGSMGQGAQYIAPGARVVAGKGFSSGNYTTYTPGVDDPTNVVGVILGVRNTYPIQDYVNRVRTLYNPKRLVGPIVDPNPASIQMGGSATSGMDFIINLTTDGIFNAAYTQGTTLRPEYSTYVEVAFRSF